MKNKDGIVIKPGQVWNSHLGQFTEERVVALDNGDVLTRSFIDRNTESKAVFNRAPSHSTFNILLKAPGGADLAAARKEGWLIWVEGLAIPDRGSVMEWAAFGNKGMSRTHITFFPSHPDPSAVICYKLKPEEPEQLKYKLFEGRSIDNHRVFGFTDNPDWVELTEHLELSVESYEPTPCDHTGTRRFAIGRLEV